MADRVSLSMSKREVDVDALFDRSADTQLLERRRREELGLIAHAAPATATAVRFGPESILADEAPPGPRAAMLRVSLDARPDRALIPGAVVTVVASIHDDGDADAADVVLRIAIPHECEAMPDSFARDDDSLDGEALLGEGVRIGTIAAGSAVRVRFALRVLPGTRPLDVIAHARAPGVATIAAPALRLARRAGHTAFDAPRPFFELESDETDDTLAAVAAAAPQAQRAVDAVIDEPAAPVVVAPEIVPRPTVAPARVVVPVPVPAPQVITPDFIVVEPLDPDPVVAEPVVTEAVVIEAVVIEPVGAQAPPPETESAPKPKPRKRATRGKKSPDTARPFVLARTLEDDAVRALERVFAGPVPHGLAALALLSSIAAVESPLGGALGVREFARTISVTVPRALVAARMSRPVPPVVTRESLETIDALAAVPSEPFAQYFPLLVTRLDERELGALRTVLARDLDDPFLRGAQVLLAVAPRALDGVGPERGPRAAEALAAYRGAAGAWLMRVTVRRAVDRRYDPLVANDATLHEAGRTLVAALRAALG